DRSRIGFGLNGKPFEKVTYPLRRDDIGQAFWYVPAAADSGFHCRMQVSREQVFANGFATFNLLDTLTGRPFDSRHDCYSYDIRNDRLPFPDAQRRVRVHGGEDDVSFRLEGYSLFIKLRLALRRIFGKDYDSFGRILDWGCGC